MTVLIMKTTTRFGIIHKVNLYKIINKRDVSYKKANSG